MKNGLRARPREAPRRCAAASAEPVVTGVAVAGWRRSLRGLGPGDAADEVVPAAGNAVGDTDGILGEVGGSRKGDLNPW